ncbi:MAG: hypothetical protein MPW15_20305 [Candidatus Manganitrophus sp.]|nr:hypothetical protein [Candidatus Manganitrophus sp.]
MAGRREVIKDVPVAVELRSVNHRYCDVVVRIPKLLAPLEETIKKKVQERFARGHIELSVSFNGAANAPKQFKLDLESAEAYHRILKKLKIGASSRAGRSMWR